MNFDSPVVGAALIFLCATFVCIGLDSIRHGLRHRPAHLQRQREGAFLVRHLGARRG